MVLTRGEILNLYTPRGRPAGHTRHCATSRRNITASTRESPQIRLHLSTASTSSQYLWLTPIYIKAKFQVNRVLEVQLKGSGLNLGQEACGECCPKCKGSGSAQQMRCVTSLQKAIRNSCKLTTWNWSHGRSSTWTNAVSTSKVLPLHHFLMNSSYLQDMHNTKAQQRYTTLKRENYFFTAQLLAS